MKRETVTEARRSTIPYAILEECATSDVGVYAGRSAALMDWRFRREQREFERLCASIERAKIRGSVPYRGRPRMAERLGPKHALNPSVGQPCPACDVPFKPQDVTTMVVLGPGPDAQERAKARAGNLYKATAIEVHWACATGEEP